jgi:hypothetical protein
VVTKQVLGFESYRGLYVTLELNDSKTKDFSNSLNVEVVLLGKLEKVDA